MVTRGRGWGDMEEDKDGQKVQTFCFKIKISTMMYNMINIINSGVSWLIGKDSDAARDWGQEETGTTEDEMAGWHYWLDGREFEWTLGVGDGQGGLVCCDSWGHKESDMTERLNWTELTDVAYESC